MRDPLSRDDNRNNLDASYDGRYVWVLYPLASPRLILIDQAKDQQWAFNAADGLPPMTQGGSLAAVGGGDAILFGSFKTEEGDLRSWVARATLNDDGKLTVKMLREFKRVRGVNESDPYREGPFETWRARAYFLKGQLRAAVNMTHVYVNPAGGVITTAWKGNTACAFDDVIGGNVGDCTFVLGQGTRNMEPLYQQAWKNCTQLVRLPEGSLASTPTCGCGGCHATTVRLCQCKAKHAACRGSRTDPAILCKQWCPITMVWW